MNAGAPVPPRTQEGFIILDEDEKCVRSSFSSSPVTQKRLGQEDAFYGIQFGTVLSATTNLPAPGHVGSFRPDPCTLYHR